MRLSVSVGCRALHSSQMLSDWGVHLGHSDCMDVMHRTPRLCSMLGCLSWGVVQQHANHTPPGRSAAQAVTPPAWGMHSPWPCMLDAAGGARVVPAGGGGGRGRNPRPLPGGLCPVREAGPADAEQDGEVPGLAGQRCGCACGVLGAVSRVCRGQQMWQGSVQDQRQQHAVEGALAAPCWRLPVSMQPCGHCKHAHRRRSPGSAADRCPRAVGQCWPCRLQHALIKYSLST